MSLPFDAGLKKILKTVPHPQIREVLDWALLPPGKLFRPRLVESLGLDAGLGGSDALLNLGLALELHHAYSLVHDDMPCMDNDLVRRGKPTTHKQFGEWKALLGGDTLLAMSYAQLEKIQHPQSAFIRRSFHWATGGKGLILGQWMDLSLAEVTSPQGLLRMHELKTARLMQVATLGTQALTGDVSLKKIKQSLKLGRDIGLVFQLLDDLDDLTGPEVSAHEGDVNPFLLAPDFMGARLAALLGSLEQHLTELPQTRAFLQAFLRQSALGLLTQKAQLRARLPSIAARLEALLTSGVFA